LVSGPIRGSGSGRVVSALFGRCFRPVCGLFRGRFQGPPAVPWPDREKPSPTREGSVKLPDGSAAESEPDPPARRGGMVATYPPLTVARTVRVSGVSDPIGNVSSWGGTRSQTRGFEPEGWVDGKSADGLWGIEPNPWGAWGRGTGTYLRVAWTVQGPPTRMRRGFMPTAVRRRRASCRTG
jgi:hypothetical protein